MKKIRANVVLILAAVMIFTSVPGAALADNVESNDQYTEPAVFLQAVTPAQMTEAVSKFTDALSKFFADTSKMSDVSAFLTRFGGLTSAASGVVGILQMSGIVQDPTKVALGEILDTVHNIQDQLKEMDTKLNSIQQDLVNIQVSIEEKDRNNKASTMLKNWNDFNRDYCEPLDRMIEQYEGKINAGIKEWWEKGPADGLFVVYSGSESFDKDKLYLNYSKTVYGEDFPTAADNGEGITLCFGVPKEYLPDTTNMEFNIDKYRSDFEKAMAAAFLQAAKDNKIKMTDNLKQYWYADSNGPSDAEKQELAESFAADILNTQIYHIAGNVMSNNDAWVIDVKNAYNNYCSHVLGKDTGIDALLNAMYLTHGFEGEIKDDINKFCDSMTAKAGTYGQFALSCVCQDNMQSLAKRQETQQMFADTVIRLTDKKALATTGYDNYCYVTGTKVEYAWLDATSTLTVKTKGSAYKSCSSTNWSLTVPNLLDNVYSQVLYHQYRALDQGKSSFSSYLKAYGVFPWDNWNGVIMTQYKGGQTFDLSEGIRMKASSYFSGEDYFGSGKYYKINSGNDSDVENKYFHLHDKLVYDTFDMSTGAVALNQVAGARAFYGESHWNWRTDEAWRFATDSVSTGNTTGKDGDNNTVTKTNYVIHMVALKLNPVKNLNGGAEDNDPFFAFGAPTLISEVSDVLGPIIEDNTTALTSIKLSATKFTYTGNKIKPKVTVKAGKKTVPASGYKVTYLDNKKPGYATVVVEGKGKYSGKVTKRFKILPKKTSISKIRRLASAVQVTWKKQSTKMSSAKVTGYQIRYSTSSSMKNAKTVKVKGYKTTVKKIKGLKKNKKYYFRIRTYMTKNNKTIYSAWSKTKILKKKA